MDSQVQKDKMVEALRKGFHAYFEGRHYDLEVYRFHDERGEGFSLECISKNEELHPGTEDVFRNPEAVIVVMKAWCELEGWDIKNPYPEEYILEGESTLELLQNAFPEYTIEWVEQESEKETQDV